MSKKWVYMVLALVALSAFTHCAKRGMPTGGEKDTIPPVFLRANPGNFTTNFKAEEIRIHFNEFIKLQDAQKQVIFSPPLDPKPTLSPLGNPQKYIRIQFNDTLLQPNTTYTINFGNSIVDHNEENPLPFFKYVFSTGAQLDSLQISGRVDNALERETDAFVAVMLYRLDEQYTDSIPYQKPPTYIAYTKDSTGQFSLENMRAGKYKAVAIKDENSNYLYNPYQDKIDFLSDTISLPTDKTLRFSLFKEKPSFELVKLKQESARKAGIGYVGELPDSLEINQIYPTYANAKLPYIKSLDTDTLYYFVPEALKQDSLVIAYRHQQQVDTLHTRVKELYKDSLQFTPLTKPNIGLLDSIGVYANVPKADLDLTKVSLTDQDSAAVAFKSVFKPIKNQWVFRFESAPSSKYNLQLLPGAFTDIYGATNDTLSFNYQTPSLDNLANLQVNVSIDSPYPLLVQVLNDRDEVVRSISQNNAQKAFAFNYLKPGNYYVRLIEDANGNKQWDTGNYLKKQKPEKVHYLPGKVELRANWEVVEQFSIR